MTSKYVFYWIFKNPMHRVMVLDEGHIAEFDTPEKLLELKGIFYNLATNAGITISI